MFRGLTTGRTALFVATATVLAVAVACGGDSSSSPSAAAPSTGGSSATTTGTVSEDGTILLIGKDNWFEPNTFTGKGGQKITVTLDNRGAQIHNWQIIGQKGPDGQEIQTPLLPGGQKGSVEFTLPSGSYDFFCAVHPVDMRGKMTLQ